MNTVGDQIMKRIQELDSENDRLGTAGMRARDWSRAWKQAAKKLWRNYNSLAEARLKRWNELNCERSIVYELEAENARLRAALARLTAAASKVWPSVSGHYAREELGGRLRELSDAMEAATAALGGNDETL